MHGRMKNGLRLRLVADETVSDESYTSLWTSARQHGHRLRRTRGRQLRHTEVAVTESSGSWPVGWRNAGRVLAPQDALELFVNISLRIPALQPGVRVIAGNAFGSYGDSELTDHLRPIFEDVPAWHRKVTLRRRPGFAIEDPPGNFQAYGAMAVVSPRIASRSLKMCTLVTRPDCRRRGHAGILLGHVLDLARLNELSPVYTTVGEGSGGMRAFLEANGFEVVGRKERTGEAIMQHPSITERPIPLEAGRPYAQPGLRFATYR